MWLRPIHCVWMALLALVVFAPTVCAADGYALEFDGVDDYVDVPTMEYAFEDGDVFTIELWSRWYDTVRSLCAYRYQLERNRFRTRGSAELAAQTGITNQEWHHVAAVYDGSGATKYLTVYVDGVQTGTANTTGSPLSSYTGNTLRFGMTRHSSGQYSHCAMDEVRIWNVARSLADIQTYMMRGLAGGEDGLIGYWTFDEGQGATVQDRSPRGNHGTVAGASWTTETAPVAPGPAPAAAHGPFPANGADDVPRDVVLAWKPGGYAHTHDVYLGSTFEDVDTADRADPKGVLVSQGQDANSYDPTDVLEFGKVYYWRVDEVNAPPDSTILKGGVWSFTVEPFTYRVTALTATASSSDAATGPENAINNSGMNADDQHSTASPDMWLSGKDGSQPTWIQFEFDGIRKLHEMRVWNYNVLFENVLGFGFKEVTVEHSLDGIEWISLGEMEFARAPGRESYAADTIVSLAGVTARYVRLTAQSNWGGLMPQFGLSEVRFYHLPVTPREPRPASTTTDVETDAVLSWRIGREAASHRVYFGTDADAVANDAAPVEIVTDNRFDPGPLNLGTTYYWKVAEVNDVETPAVWEGGLWSFTTKPYILIDDMESYNDEDNRIYDAWIDGWVNNTGSQVGYEVSPFAEKTIVYGGRQSMPLAYDNADTPFYSEAEREFPSTQDWTTNGADTLMVSFRGNPVRFLEPAPGSVTMSAGGADIWNAADEFRFAFKRLNGNGAIVAKVESVENSDPWAKGGVMIRESLEPGSRFAAVYATPGQGVRYQARLLNLGAATSDTSIATPEQMALTMPIWIKIERTGSNFSCFYSADGVQWTAMSWNPQTINMVGTVYIGLAVTSHNTAATTTAEFTNISTTGGVTGAWEVADIGVAQPANDPAPLYVAVQDSAGKIKVVRHPDPAATSLATWQRWPIPLTEFTSAGVNMARVKKVFIGAGDRDNPSKGGAGLLYIDDIGFGRPITTNP